MQISKKRSPIIFPYTLRTCGLEWVISYSYIVQLRWSFHCKPHQGCIELPKAWDAPLVWLTYSENFHGLPNASRQLLIQIIMMLGLLECVMKGGHIAGAHRARAYKSIVYPHLE